MDKKKIFKVSLIVISLLLVTGLLICSNAIAGWGWGSQFGSAGWGAYNGNGSFNSWYGGGFPWTLPASKTEKKWKGWKCYDWEKFIEKLSEKYPDLEGINWENWEEWDKEDWAALRVALQEVRDDERLDRFIEYITKKFNGYDYSDWEDFIERWENFIAVATEDEKMDAEEAWADFVNNYDCFDLAVNTNDVIDCWKESKTWDEIQWEEFQGIYCDFINYEWHEFMEELKNRVEDQDALDWENWRNWTDEEWEEYLDKYSDFRTSKSSSGKGPSGPSGYGFGSWGFGYGGSCSYNFCPSSYNFKPSSYNFKYNSFNFSPNSYNYGFNSYNFGSNFYNFGSNFYSICPYGNYDYNWSWRGNDWWKY